MSFSTVKSAAMEGLAVEMVYVEADVSNGLPIFHMVGYLSSEVKEAAGNAYGLQSGIQVLNFRRNVW